MRKRNVFLLSAVSLLLISCGKDAAERDGAVPAGGDVVVTTKATLSSDGSIWSSRIYAFAKDGSLIGSKGADTDTLDMFLTYDTDSILAFANFIDLPENIPSRDSLLKLKAYLAYNDTCTFLMHGALKVDVTASRFEVRAKMSRYAARITWTVTNRIDTSKFPSEAFRVKDVYLLNVAGENNLGLTGEPSDNGIWYNKLDFQSSVVDILTCSGPLYQVVEKDSTFKSSRPLYAFPNSYPDKSDTVWSARATRLVVRASLGTYEYYYPVPVTPIAANGSYNVNVVVTGPGNDSPMDIGKPTYCQITIIDDMWTDGESIHSEI